MSYRRLNYEQYFIDNSRDYNQTGRLRAQFEYQAIPYKCNPLKHKLEHLLGIEHEVNYAFWYDEARDVIQIHFEKTNGNSDWYTNILEFGSKYYDAFPFDGRMLTLYVHGGWGRMYKEIKYRIREEWSALHEAHPEAETEIIGWSLGSGQAMLCAQDLNYNFGLKAYVYTFGSVRPFRAKFGQSKLLNEYLGQLTVRCYNFANRNDLVTYMPPFPGFRMIDRKNLGFQKVTIRRLLDPFTYHTIYDHKELYRKNLEK